MTVSRSKKAAPTRAKSTSTAKGKKMEPTETVKETAAKSSGAQKPQAEAPVDTSSPYIPNPNFKGAPHHPHHYGPQGHYTGQGPQQGYQQAYQQPHQYPGEGMDKSEAPAIKSLDDILRPPTSLTGEGDELVAYKEVITTIFNDDSKLSKMIGSDYHVLSVGRTETGLSIDAITLAHTIDKKAYVYTLIIGGSTGDQPMTRTESVYGRTHGCALTPGELYDAEFYGGLVGVVVEHSLPNHEILECGYAVIPASIRPEQKSVLRKMVGNATIAIENFISRGEEDGVITAGSLRALGGISARPRYTKDDLIGTNGLPNRSDVEITLSSSGFRGNPYSPQYFNRNTRAESGIVKLSAYMDLFRNDPYQRPVQPNYPDPYGYQYGGMQQTQMLPYQPQLIVSAIEQARGTHGISLESVLLGLASLEMLYHNSSWMQCFKAPYTGNNLHDIGSLGLEYNVAQVEDYKPHRINTASDQFTDRDLFDYMSSVCSREPVLSIDIEEGGTHRWVMLPFVKSANSAFNQQEAYEGDMEIIEAANNLTNGHFSEFWGQGQMIAKPEVVRVHTGTVQDSNGAIRDIREVDYLCVLDSSAEGGDLSTIEAWDGSYVDHPRNPEIVRLETREKIIANTFQSYEITGMARRVSINQAFIRALSAALYKAGVPIMADANHNQFNQQNRMYRDYSGFHGQQPYMGGDQGFQYYNQQQPYVSNHPRARTV